MNSIWYNSGAWICFPETRYPTFVPVQIVPVLAG